ncbi:MAG: riboflavin synthase [Chlorobi bacterium]|nr:riboflavin synthase [Chlorobiota bacterium]
MDLRHGDGVVVTVESPISSELSIGQSVSHDGTCLTIIEKGEGWHRVELIKPTLEKTIAKFYVPGTHVNLERSLKVGSRLEGHIVQGHVDTVLQCVEVKEEGNTRWLSFTLPTQHAHLIIPEGSIAINGVSLTVARVEKKTFSVGLIPHTLKVTNLGQVEAGTYVNCEFDIIGRYLFRFWETYNKS